MIDETVMEGCSSAGLLTVADASTVLRAHVSPIGGEERVLLSAAMGRILARDARASVASPPHDRSAMDGYALRAADAVRPLQCVGRATAARPFSRSVGPGECVAVATGAALPSDCDVVVMHEHCRVADGIVTVSTPQTSGRNIRRRAEDFENGALLLAAGTRVDPQHLGLLASAGVSTASVRRRLRVAVLSIGDELKRADTSKQSGVFDANSVMLMALCAKTGAEIIDFDIIPDCVAAISIALSNAAARCDVVISTAGTSKGQEDYLTDAIRMCGGRILVTGVAIKPGKPVSFAKLGDCLHIALPGNPAAALVTMLILGIPILQHRSGAGVRSAPDQVVRAAFAYRKKAGTREYLRVTLEEGPDGFAEAHRCANDGSAMLASMADCAGLICLNEETTEVAAGDFARYRAFEAFLR